MYDCFPLNITCRYVNETVDMYVKELVSQNGGFHILKIAHIYMVEIIMLAYSLLKLEIVIFVNQLVMIKLQ